MKPTTLCLTALLAVAVTTPARAEIELDWRGFLLTDLRLALGDEVKLDRAESSLGARLAARVSPHVAGVADLRFVWSETGEPRTFAALFEPTLADSYRFESDALYVELRDLLIDGLDVRLGREQVIWGSADRFHPESNLNALDVEDATVFGRVLATEMLHLAWRPEAELGCEDDPWLAEPAFELVVVPFFRPARLPESAGRAFSDARVFRERADTPLLQQLVAQQRVLETNNGWTFENEPRPMLPERSADNMMFGARMAARVLDIDLAVTYFQGFDDFPRAEKVIADASALPLVKSEIQLTYPRVKVIGADFATSLGFLDGAGLWGEVALTLHDDLYRVVSTGPLIGVNAIEVEEPAGGFVKAVVGMDYSLSDWLYVNVQYLHGFVDEFGAGDLGNFIVAGADIKLANDTALIRFFNVFDLDDGSYVLYPMVTFKPWSGGELGIGGFVFSSAFGWNETKKFASRAAGRSSAFLRFKVSL